MSTPNQQVIQLVNTRSWVVKDGGEVGGNQVAQAIDSNERTFTLTRMPLVERVGLKWSTTEAGLSIAAKLGKLAEDNSRAYVTGNNSDAVIVEDIPGLETYVGNLNVVRAIQLYVPGASVSWNTASKVNDLTLKARDWDQAQTLAGALGEEELSDDLHELVLLVPRLQRGYVEAG